MTISVTIYQPHAKFNVCSLQFLEAIIRIGITKFMEARFQGKTSKKKKKGGKKGSATGAEDEADLDIAGELEKRMEALGPCTSAAEAIRRLCDNFLFPLTPPESIVSKAVLSPSLTE